MFWLFCFYFMKKKGVSKSIIYQNHDSAGSNVEKMICLQVAIYPPKVSTINNYF